MNEVTEVVIENLLQLTGALLKEKQNRMDPYPPPPISIKRLFIEVLAKSHKPEALTALLKGCFLDSQEVSKSCEEAIKNLSTDKLKTLLDSIILGKDFGREGQKFFALVSELRSLDTMKYICRLVRSSRNPAEEYSQLASWVRIAGIMDTYLRKTLDYPLPTAKIVFLLLARLDGRVPEYLAKMTMSLPPQLCIKVLELLAELNKDTKATTVFIRPLKDHEDAEVRALVAYIIGHTTQNTLFMQTFLKDPAAKVRLKTIESIEENPHERSPKIKDLLCQALGDPDMKVRGMAAKILYLHGDVQGLQALKSMLESPQSLERAHAARLLGELREVSVHDTLEKLQDDSDEDVRNAVKEALSSLDEELAVLNSGFGELEGILTQHRFSENNADEKDLWGGLEALSPEVIDSMLRSTGLPPEVIQQFQVIIKEFEVNGTALPLLLATVLEKDGKVSIEKIADLSLVKKELNATIQRLQSAGPDAVSHVLKELSEMQQKTIKGMIVPALNQGDNRAMANAGKILHDLKYEIGSSKLREMIGNKDPEARRQVVKVLSQTNDRFAAEQLERLKDDPDPEIQRLARSGLANVQSKLKREELSDFNFEITGSDITKFPNVKIHTRVTCFNVHLEDLEKGDWLVLEGNKKRPLRPKISTRQNDKNAAAALAFDCSASMSTQEIKDVQAAIEGFTNRLLSEDYVAILKFAQDIQIVQGLTNDKRVLAHAVEVPYKLETQGTALYDTILRAMHELDSAKKDSNKIVLVITDGTDNASDENEHDVVRYAKECGIAVYMVGLGQDVDTDKLNQIAKLTNGRSFFVDGSHELQGTFEEIFEDLRYEWVIEYTSSFPCIDEEHQMVELYVKYGQYNKNGSVNLLTT